MLCVIKTHIDVQKTTAYLYFWISVRHICLHFMHAGLISLLPDRHAIINHHSHLGMTTVPWKDIMQRFLRIYQSDSD